MRLHRVIVPGAIVTCTLLLATPAGAVDPRQPDSSGGYASPHVVMRVRSVDEPLNRPDTMSLRRKYASANVASATT